MAIESMKGKKVYYPYKLFLAMVSCFPMDNVSTCIGWMF